MRRAALLLLVLAVLAAPSLGDENPPPRSEAWKLGYSIGYQVGGDLRRDGREIDVDLLVEGVLHALENAAPRLTPAEMREALSALQKSAAAAGTGADEAALAGPAGWSVGSTTAY
jgi:hypothetical protein